MGVKYLYGIDVTGQSTFSTNVGIGTLSPGYRLDVQGSAGNIARITDGTNHFLFYAGSGLNEIATTGPLLLTVSGSERMRITSAGNVGIGTTNPTQKLSVSGNLSLTDSNNTILFLTNIATNGQNWNFQSYLDGNLYIGISGVANYLNIIAGTGAATFSSSVTASSIIKLGGTSTQYLMADGSVSTLTNPVTGTGTTNYLPKWTSGSAIGNSIIFNDATGVGIGTINPSYTFHTVSANTTIGAFRNSGAANGQLLVGNTVGDLALRILASGDSLIFSDTSKYLAFGTNGGTERARISSTGNLGIGTTAPSEKLEVKGVDSSTVQAIFQANAGALIAYNGGIQLGNATGNQNSQIYHNSSGDNTLTFVSNYSSGTTNKFIFAPGGTERVRFLQNGNVGIGTTAPAYLLDVIGTGRFIHTAGVPSLNIRASDANFALMSILGNQTGDVNWLLMSGYPAAGDFTIRQSDTVNALTLAKTTGAAAFSSSVTATNILTTGTGTIFDTNNAGTSSVRAAFTNTGGTFFIGKDNSTGTSFGAAYASILYEAGANPMVFWTNATERLRITSSGNVGIGTTNPGTKLEVYSIVRVTESASGGILQLEANAGVVSITSTFYGGTYKPMTFLNGGSERMRLDTSGNLGIGTTAPAAKLDVEGDVSIKNVNLSNQENLDVDTGTEVIAIAPIALYTAAFFDFVVKNGANVRSGTVYACHDGTSVEYTETSTADLGNTSAVVFTVDISAGNMRLLATTTTDNWSIKTLTRTI